MSLFKFQSYDSYRTAIALFRLCAEVAQRHEAARPAAADALRRASVALPLLIARSSVPGPRSERMTEVRGALKAARRIRTLLHEMTDARPRDAATAAALELADRSAELLLSESEMRDR